MARLLVVMMILAIGADGVRAELRPPVAGRSAGVSAGHPLTAAAAFEILLAGGNAFDAGVAALLAGGVVESDLYSLGGEALVLVYPRRDGKVTAVAGQGWAPKAATIDYYLSRNKTLRGEGLDPAVVPGALHAALTVLERWGTMSFERVARRALDLAENGYPLRPRTVRTIENSQKFIANWPDNQRVWLKPDGSLYKAGETIRQPDLARTLRRMAAAERAARARGRAAGIAAARNRFYKGDIAREMVAFLKKHDAPFELPDFAEFFARVEEPASTTYREYTIYKHGFSSQGPALLQTLNILEHFDLRAMKHNSADYIHTVIEALKLSYADRDTYYADQAFVKSPAAGLLSKEYAKERAAQIKPKSASRLFAAGNPLPYDPVVKKWDYWVAKEEAAGPPAASGGGGAGAARGASSGGDASAAYGASVAEASEKDTTHIAIIDKAGNIFDCTPSGGWINGAVILGKTGIGMSTRGEQFWLDKTRAAHLRPRSRPRYTLTPGLVLRGKEPFLAIGTPGGDNQDQTVLQAFLNIAEFWPQWYPNLHEAFEWPRFQTMHFFGSFWPHPAGFNEMNVEAGVSEEVYKELAARGHKISRVRPFSITGCATAVMIDPATANRIAGADPRRDCYAMAY